MHATATMARLALRNVQRNWRHSMATVLSIAAGFMAVSLFDGFIAELIVRNEDGYSTRGMLGHVLVQKRDAQTMSSEDQWAYALNTKEQDFLDTFLKAAPEFKRRVRFLSVSGLASSGASNPVFTGFGYDVEDGLTVRGERWAWNTIAGKPLHLAQEPAVVLGGGLGRLLDCEPSSAGPSFILEDGNYKPEERPFTCRRARVMLSATTEAAQVNAIELPIIGFIDAGFREADKRALNLPLAVAQRLLDTDKITTISVELKSNKDVEPFVKRLRQAAEGQGFAFDIMPWQEHSLAAYVQGGMEILQIFRNLFMTVVVTIGVMSVANTMMKSVNERTREIGTLRSIGFLRRHIVRIIAYEGLLLSLLACALGLAATITMTAVIGHLGLTYRAGILSIPISLKVRHVPVAWLASTALLSVLATGTAWFCARKAARMVVADALRHV